MEFIKKLFRNGQKGNGEDKDEAASPLDKKPKRKTDSSMFCNPEEQQRRDAEVEAVKKKAEESHRDLTQTIEDFNEKPRKKHGELQTPKA